MKYKLLKDTPAHKAGTIFRQGLSETLNIDIIYPLDSVNRICELKDVTNEWFAPYLFTTEDSVDIYKGDAYYTMVGNNSYVKVTAHAFANYSNDIKKFSTADAAQKYLDSLNVPEYVECITEVSWGGYTKGKIYKVKRIANSTYLTEFDDKGSTTNGWHKKNFKPSTKEEYEAQFVKYNVGDWVIASIGDIQYIGRYVETIKDGIRITEWCSLNIILDGRVYCDNGTGLWNKVDRLATQEEIETYLMLLAESKGFVKGVCFKNALTGYNSIIDNNCSFFYNKEQDGLGVLNGGWVYYKSQWATIVEKPEPKAEYFYYHTSGTFDVEFTGKVTDVSINDNKVKINYTT